ncbi:MAG: amino acid ABC transporter permease [Steroidobacteraceae bacterium]
MPTASVLVRERVIHRRDWLSPAVAAGVAGLLAVLVAAAIRARIVDPAVLLKYLAAPQILLAAFNGFVLGTLALLLAMVVGLLVALMRMSRSRLMRYLAGTYIYLFRGTPMLIQLLFWFNAIPAMFRSIHIAVPFTSWVLVDAPTTGIVTPLVAGICGLGFAEAAYMAEIIRGGVQAIDQGQRAAARALGMTHLGVFRHVVGPQAARVILPAIGNDYIMLLKSASLASTIGYMELLRVSTDIYSANFRVVELLLVCAFWYLMMTALVTVAQTLLERRFPVR